MTTHNEYPTIPVPEETVWPGNPHSPHFEGCDDACMLCGRPLCTKGTTTWWIHLVSGGVEIAHRDAPDDSADPENLGHYPVGSSCIKRIPTAYRVRSSDMFQETP